MFAFAMSKMPPLRYIESFSAPPPLATSHHDEVCHGYCPRCARSSPRNLFFNRLLPSPLRRRPRDRAFLLSPERHIHCHLSPSYTCFRTIHKHTHLYIAYCLVILSPSLFSASHGAQQEDYRRAHARERFCRNAVKVAAMSFYNESQQQLPPSRRFIHTDMASSMPYHVPALLSRVRTEVTIRHLLVTSAFTPLPYRST